MEPEAQSPVWLNVLVLVVVGGSLFAFVFLRHQRKVTALEDLAARRGLRFREHGYSSIGPPGGTLLAKEGKRAFKARFSLDGEIDGAEVTIYDAHFTDYRPGSQVSKMYHYPSTVIEVRSGDIGLPRFTLRPATWMQKAVIMLGGDDIPVASHPEFTKQYRLTARDPEAAIALFDGPLAEFFAARRGMVFEGLRDGFILWWKGKRLKAAAREAALDDALHLAALLKSRGNV